MTSKEATAQRLRESIAYLERKGDQFAVKAGGEGGVECFRVFATYQHLNNAAQRDVLSKLRDWATSEEARLDTADGRETVA